MNDKVKTVRLISQETWDKFTEKEKENIKNLFKEASEHTLDRSREVNMGLSESLEYIFGKENLQYQQDTNERRYFLRFGELPQNGRSSIYRGEEKIGEENGVSVFDCTQDTYQLILPQKLSRSLMSDVQGFFNYLNRPLYLVSGVQVGIGHDNEPIITDVKVECELPYNEENREPKIKTWEDVERECPNIKTETDNLNFHISTCIAFDDKIEKKLIATYKISKLIEIGYGGRVTDDEWKDDTLDKFFIGWIEEGKHPYIKCHFGRFQDDFISFHTRQQAEEFMSYPENLKLINDYYMI